MVFGLSGSAKKYTILFKDSNVTTELALARAMVESIRNLKKELSKIFTTSKLADMLEKY